MKKYFQFQAYDMWWYNVIILIKTRIIVLKNYINFIRSFCDMWGYNFQWY